MGLLNVLLSLAFFVFAATGQAVDMEEEVCAEVKFRLRSVGQPRKCLTKTPKGIQIKICRDVNKNQAWDLQEATDVRDATGGKGHRLALGTKCLNAMGKLGKCTGGTVFSFEVNAVIPQTRIRVRGGGRCLAVPGMRKCSKGFKKKAQPQLWFVEPLL